MALLTTNITAQIDWASKLDRLWAALEFAAKLSPKYRAITYFNAKSDEELAEMGMTRADVVKKVYGAQYHI